MGRTSAMPLLKAQHTAALLNGYGEFQTLLFDSDTGLVWFEYRLPEAVDVTQAAALIAEQISEQKRCFEAHESFAYEVRLRCAQPRSGSFAEYLVIIAPQGRRSFVMYASIDSEAELVGYPIAVQDFKRRARGEAPTNVN